MNKSIKKKKVAYKLKILEEMHLASRKVSKSFWKLLDKISPKQGQTSPAGNIKINEWVRHFQLLRLT